jgi:glucose-1-phosphate cytidylyltransferase
MLTYGDGVSDINIKELVDFHKKSGKLATLTAIQPSGKFGAIDIEESGSISSFTEKPQGDGAWINGGFFVLEPQVFDYIKDGDSTIWERNPLEGLAKDNQLNAYKHKGFWQPMDTLRDKMELTEKWTTGKAPWALWLKGS